MLNLNEEKILGWCEQDQRIELFTLKQMLEKNIKPVKVEELGLHSVIMSYPHCSC